MISSLQNTTGDFWTPPSSLVNHGGEVLTDQVRFFGSPPAEIGQLLSAHSSMGPDLKGKKRDGYGTFNNWLQALIWAFMAGMFSWFILSLATGNEILATVLAWLLAAFVVWRTLQKDVGLEPATCTFVGTQGLAQYTWDKDESKRQTPLVVRFQDVTELRTLETRQFVNNAYLHTTYIYQWSKGATAKFAVGGVYRDQKGTPPAKDRYHFALAAEHAWTVFMLDHTLQQLTQGQSVNFEMKNGDTLTLSTDAIELKRKGETIRLGYEDVPQLSVHQGVMTLSSKDTTRSFFGTTGVYSFKYHDVPNAQLLLLLFNTIMKR
jgi:hypothetical protein